jgi:hypothetical protein
MKHYSDFYEFYNFMYDQFRKLRIDKSLLDDKEFMSELLLLGSGLHERIVNHDMRLSIAMSLFKDKINKLKYEFTDKITDI